MVSEKYYQLGNSFEYWNKSIKYFKVKSNLRKDNGIKIQNIENKSER